MQSLCSRSEQCSADIYRKALKALDSDEEQAAEIVASLVADKYIDDARYASAYARDKAHLEGWGPVKIRFQLRTKGIDSAAIAEALDSIDSNLAEKRLEKMLLAKYKLLKEDPQVRLKLLKYILGRGYEYDAASVAVEKILSNG